MSRRRCCCRKPTNPLPPTCEDGCDCWRESECPATITWTIAGMQNWTCNCAFINSSFVDTDPNFVGNDWSAWYEVWDPNPCIRNFTVYLYFKCLPDDKCEVTGLIYIRYAGGFSYDINNYSSGPLDRPLTSPIVLTWTSTDSVGGLCQNFQNVTITVEW